MPLPKAVESYFEAIEGPMQDVATALAAAVCGQNSKLKATLAWGHPCWFSNERIFSIIPHARHCNLQLWAGARLAPHYLGRIEGSGKSLRHVKVRSPDEIDDELVDIIDRAIMLDAEEGVRVR